MITVTIHRSNDSYAGFKVVGHAREDRGIVELILEGSVSDKTTLLLDSMILGLRDIQTQYGNEFIRLKIEEV